MKMGNLFESVSLNDPVEKENRVSKLAIQLIPLVMRKYLSESNGVAEFGMGPEDVVSEAYRVAEHYYRRKEERLEQAREQREDQKEEEKDEGKIMEAEIEVNGAEANWAELASTLHSSSCECEKCEKNSDE